MTSPITFAAAETYPVAILLKESSFNRLAIDANYVRPLVERNIDKSELVAFPLAYNDSQKAPVKHIKSMLDRLLPQFTDLGVTTLYCADAAYFKVLAGVSKAEVNLGYALPAKYQGYEKFTVVLGVNHSSIIYNPINENKLLQSLDALAKYHEDQDAGFSESILRHAHYPSTLDDIVKSLQVLHKYSKIAVDIETFSLHHHDAYIGTIGFAINATDGIAFAVDYQAIIEKNGVQGKISPRPSFRMVLREFFDTYQGTLIVHKANFDLKILIRWLYMDHDGDIKNLLKGLHTLTRKFDDTRIIAYLAINSCIKPDLSLKTLAQSYAGNFGIEEINDIKKVDLPTLLTYNLTDCCSTYWLHNTYYPKMVADDQLEIYENLMLPSLKTIIQMELTGMPLNPDRVQEVKQQLEIIASKHLHVIVNHPKVIETQEMLTETAWEEDYQSRKRKAKHPDKIKRKDRDTFPMIKFLPNSPKQLQTLLYTTLNLRGIERTKTGQLATGADVIEKLSTHVTDASIKELFQALIGYSQAQKILSTFIAAFEKAIPHTDDDPRAYIHGSFNLGGTVSGRLSSSDPNLQNLPSGSVYGKLVKSCIQANDSQLFVGADFNSLEAMINALTTKDPNKLAVYEDGLDSHAWNAFGYWPEQMPEIKAKMDLANSPGKFYKRTEEDGSVTYLHESEL